MSATHSGPNPRGLPPARAPERAGNKHPLLLHYYYYRMKVTNGQISHFLPSPFMGWRD